MVMLSLNLAFVSVSVVLLKDSFAVPSQVLFVKPTAAAVVVGNCEVPFAGKR